MARGMREAADASPMSPPLASANLRTPPALDESQDGPVLGVAEFAGERRHPAPRAPGPAGLAAVLRRLEQVCVVVVPRVTGRIVGRCGMTTVRQLVPPVRLSLELFTVARGTVLCVEPLPGRHLRRHFGVNLSGGARDPGGPQTPSQRDPQQSDACSEADRQAPAPTLQSRRPAARLRPTPVGPALPAPATRHLRSPLARSYTTLWPWQSPRRPTSRCATLARIWRTGGGRTLRGRSKPRGGK